MAHAEKVVVIGLDCAEPRLVFEKYRGTLPAIERILRQGIHGRLRSCDPPITCPAWMSMMASKDPGVLGFYGFRNRVDYASAKMAFATSLSVKEPLLWDYLGQAGKRVILLGVPQTYPPRPVNGLMVNSFLAPSIESNYTYPPTLKREIASVVGRYMIDIENFRTDDKDRLRRDLFAMTEKRFRLARYFLRTKPWDFFMMVEMGTDRAHHGFWKAMDPAHPRHEPGNPYEHVIDEYYQYVDQEIARVLELLPDDATVIIVSDHGARCMLGGICINEWLVEKGYLVLHEYPDQPTRFEQLAVDWSRTRAWAAGGYYARVFLNVAGREPQGVVPPAEYESFRSRLAAEIEAIPDAGGRPLATRAVRPQDVYVRATNVPPDLIVYFDDLAWRSVGIVGGRTIHTLENDTGPDDANHDWNGIFIMKDGRLQSDLAVEGLQIMDVAPTILTRFGLPVPPDMQGRAITESTIGHSSLVGSH